MFDFLKIFGLFPGSLLSSFSESNTSTLSPGRFLLTKCKSERFYLALILAKYGKPPPKQNTLDCSSKPELLFSWCRDDAYCSHRLPLLLALWLVSIDPMF